MQTAPAIITAGRLRRAEPRELRAIAQEVGFDHRSMTDRDRQIVAGIWRDRIMSGRPTVAPRKNPLGHVLGTAAD